MTSATAPTRPHLITAWAVGGAHHRRCTCGAGTPGPGLRPWYDDETGTVVQWGYQRADTYVAACRAAAAVASVLEVVADLVGRLQLEPALAVLAALAGADESPAPAEREPAPTESPEPARAEPAVDAAAPADAGAGATTPGPAQAVSGPPELPAGYVRVWWWPCGHSAGAPTEHNWPGHRHPCPKCSDGAADPRCHGVQWVDPRHDPPPSRERPCTTCGAPSARLYMTGWRCEDHAPRSTRPEPSLTPEYEWRQQAWNPPQ